MVVGDKVQLVGFGTFETRERGERVGKNHRTGEEVIIAACKAPASSIIKRPPSAGRFPGGIGGTLLMGLFLLSIVF